MHACRARELRGRAVGSRGKTLACLEASPLTTRASALGHRRPHATATILGNVIG